MTEEHYEVCVGDHSCLVHTSHMDERKKKEVIAAVGNTLSTVAYHQYEPSSYLYRKMTRKEFDESLDTGPGLESPVTGEKWLSESLANTERFQNRGVTAETPNVGHEGNAKIHEFNRHIVTVKQIDPESVTNRNAALHWLKNASTEIMAAFGVVWDGYNLTLSIIEDKGIGKSVVVSVAEIGFGKLDEYIGELIGTSFMPGMGTTAGNIIGSYIASLLGGSLTSFFIGYKSVAQG